MDFAQDLAKTQAGWSPERPITERAFAIIKGAPHPEVLAAEIASLQDAAAACLVAAMGHEPPPVSPRPGFTAWRLSPCKWAEYLVGGGYKVERTFFAPIDAEPEDAARYWWRVGNGRPVVTGADVQIVTPYIREFVMAAQ